MCYKTYIKAIGDDIKIILYDGSDKETAYKIFDIFIIACHYTPNVFVGITFYE